jgi:hypothetical protein
MKSNLLFFLGLNVLFLITCGYPVENAGPCVHTYKEPILHVSSVKDAKTNLELDKVYFYSIKINNYDTPVSQIEMDEYHNIEFFDTVMVCTVPFSFGIASGDYQFNTAIEGYKEKINSIKDVEYSIKEGGCPSYEDGGLQIELILNPIEN